MKNGNSFRMAKERVSERERDKWHRSMYTFYTFDLFCYQICRPVNMCTHISINLSPSPCPSYVFQAYLQHFVFDSLPTPFYLFVVQTDMTSVCTWMTCHGVNPLQNLWLLFEQYTIYLFICCTSIAEFLRKVKIFSEVGGERENAICSTWKFSGQSLYFLSQSVCMNEKTYFRSWSDSHLEIYDT